MTDALSLMKQHALVVGPRFKPGFPPNPQTGWYVYLSWVDADRDAFLPEQDPFTQADTLEDAVRLASEKLSAVRWQQCEFCEAPATHRIHSDLGPPPGYIRYACASHSHKTMNLARLDTGTVSDKHITISTGRWRVAE